ncbi:hypothetical protein ACIQVU_07905 [Lysinibacillus sp. NPDC098008]|uniref:hypothetical protein n=1 Tax=Lysinibacillus sp. NPDC098008 TaxID=3364146 RepID=UPI00380C76CD
MNEDIKKLLEQLDQDTINRINEFFEESSTQRIIKEVVFRFTENDKEDVLQEVQESLFKYIVKRSIWDNGYLNLLSTEESYLRKAIQFSTYSKKNTKKYKQTFVEIPYEFKSEVANGEKHRKNKPVLQRNS